MLLLPYILLLFSPRFASFLYSYYFAPYYYYYYIIIIIIIIIYVLRCKVLVETKIENVGTNLYRFVLQDTSWIVRCGEK